MEQGETPKRGRGRPRTPGAEEKILHAALEEYGEHGWSGFTMDGVARRAGVGKSTVYLRWTDKDALLTEAVRQQSQTITTSDTGSLRGDLEDLVTRLFANLTDAEGWAGFRAVVDTASATEPLGEFSDQISGLHREIVTEVFDRAEARGEHTRTVEPNPVLDLLYGATLFFVLGHRLSGEELTEEMTAERVAAIVTVVLEGIRTG